MTSSDSGAGRTKPVVQFAILFALIFVGIKVIPAYVRNYQLQDHIRQSAVEASANRLPAQSVQRDVVGYAQSLGLPVAPEDVQVTVSVDKVTIKVNYTVPVDLKVYVWNLQFSPTAENRFL